jgi:hypothetical protein
MPFCSQCGLEMDEGSAFCSQCGRPQGQQEPLPPSSAKDPLHQSYQVRIREYLRSGWEIFKKYPGPFIGFTAILGVVLALENIPYLGKILIFVLGAPLGVGPMIVAAKLAQGQPVQFADFFSGYHFFKQLVFRDLTIYGVMIITALPWVIPLSLLSIRSRGMTMMAGWQISMMVLAGLVGLIWFLLIIYLTVCWVFSSLFILDRRLSFWEAMEASRQAVKNQWFPFFLFLLALALINLGGCLALMVGLLVTWPFTLCALAAAFTDIFGLQSKDY